MQGKFTTDCDGSVRHRKWQEPAGTPLMALTAYNFDVKDSGHNGVRRQICTHRVNASPSGTATTNPKQKHVRITVFIPILSLFSHKSREHILRQARFTPNIPRAVSELQLAQCQTMRCKWCELGLKLHRNCAEIPRETSDATMSCCSFLSSQRPHTQLCIV